MNNSREVYQFGDMTIEVWLDRVPVEAATRLNEPLFRWKGGGNPLNLCRLAKFRLTNEDEKEGILRFSVAWFYCENERPDATRLAFVRPEKIVVGRRIFQVCSSEFEYGHLRIRNDDEAVILGSFTLKQIKRQREAITADSAVIDFSKFVSARAL